MMKKKIVNNRKGFSLAELLFVVLLVSFITLMLTVGITAGLRVYRDVIFESESRVLISSINESLEDMLEYSTLDTNQDLDQTVTGDGYQNVISFNNNQKVTIGDKKKLKYGITNGQVYVNNGFVVITSPKNWAGEKILGGKGIYSNNRLEVLQGSFPLQYNKTEKIYRFSYMIRDRKNTSNKTEQIELYIRLN